MRTARIQRNLNDRVYIVTGSSRGIGREIARVLLSLGGLVVLNGRDPERLESTRAELEDHLRNQPGVPSTSGGTVPRVVAIAADVGTEEGASRLISSARDTWGRIDGLINNAGVSMRGDIAEIRCATIDSLYRGNILSTFLPTIAALPELKKTGGSVIFVSTVSALWGFPGVSVYSATKAAVERFAQALDAEYRGAGIHAGTVFLGFVENDPDKETLSADGSRMRYSRKAHMTQQEAALAIIRAAVQRKHQVITIPTGRYLSALVRLCPGLVRWILARKKQRFHAVARP